MLSQIPDILIPGDDDMLTTTSLPESDNSVLGGTGEEGQQASTDSENTTVTSWFERARAVWEHARELCVASLEQQHSFIVDPVQNESGGV